LTLKDRFGRVTIDWREAGTVKRSNKRSKTHYRCISYFKKKLLAHRIVYRALIGPLDPNKVLNHLDGNGLNNHPSNLEQISQSDNCLHSYRTLNRSVVRPGKIDFEIAESIRSERKSGISVQDLHSKYGLSTRQIYKILHKKCWNPESNLNSAKSLVNK
jgi:hypothetical protein